MRIRNGRHISSHAVIRTLQTGNMELENRIRYLECGVLTDDRVAQFLNNQQGGSIVGSPEQIELRTLSSRCGRYTVNSSMETPC